ncbi:putative secreted protein [Xanthomonas bromi]|uniref:Putative secreted protein n=1 Tax=Xanthomonas bromi TaxID=56449 RepID=A0A1C3NIX4_9XANT|nr:putative secreted protein [Xanthomonas bromi]
MQTAIAAAVCMRGARTLPLSVAADASVWRGAVRGQSFRQGREHRTAGGTGAHVLMHRDPDVQGNANLPWQHRQQA